MKSFPTFTNQLANKHIAEFAPPFKSYFEHNGDIISFLEKMFADYKKLVRGIDCLEAANLSIQKMVEHFKKEHQQKPISVSFDLVRDIDRLCDAIINSLNAYFSGFPGKTYEVMEGVFVQNDGHLFQLLPQIVCEKGNMHFYRMRIGDKKEAKDLVHVPFDKRYNTRNYRFSINGTPSLYCVETLETCILENHVQPNSEISVAKFVFPAQNGIKLVDLTMPGCRPLSFWEEYSLIVFYPLIIACSLKVKEESGYFKPEYVIPQLFYQVLRLHSFELAEDIRGVAYTSTKYDNPDFTDMKQT